MLFDNFDKKIKEAAEQHHPAYDENAWRKMETLLNEHLPREKDRRRFFLLAFTVLVIGGGAFFLISRPHVKKTEQVVLQNKTSTNTKPQADDKTGNRSTVVLPAIDNGSREIASDNDISGTATRIENKSDNRLDITNQKFVSNSKSTQKVADNESLLNNVNVERDKDVAVGQPQQKNKESLKAPVTSQPNSNVKDIAADNGALSKVNAPTTSTTTQQVQASVATKATPKKGRPRTMNGLSFFVATGPDISKAQNSKTGKITMSWGLGIAYTLGRFTLKTGVFSADKIYWAGPDDYKLSYTPPPSLKFMGADANCRVIEIPVKVNYNFAVKDKTNWFAGAGLSSYLMKREDYLYEYKSNTGGSYYHSYEAKNENKHYFSVVNLSGGYSYQLSKTISLSAEPYVEVPLTGIGTGKVHLNSGGVLFTVGVSPFRK